MLADIDLFYFSSFILKNDGFIEKANPSEKIVKVKE